MRLIPMSVRHRWKRWRHARTWRRIEAFAFNRVPVRGAASASGILHAAKMSPFKLASSLTPEDTAGLYDALRTTLTDAVARSHGLAAAGLKSEKKTGLRVHDLTGEHCPVCGDSIREVSFSDSSLQYCTTCQTGGKPLADRRMSRLLK